MLFYLKEAKKARFRSNSRIEVVLESIKCIELICNTFYEKDKKYKKIKSRGESIKKTSLNFKEKLNGLNDDLNDIDGVLKILEIDEKYKNGAIDGWFARNKYDIAHANSFEREEVSTNSVLINQSAYHFVYKYLVFLKKTKSVFFSKDALDEEEWWLVY